MNTEWYYNASKWQKQLFHILETFISLSYFVIEMILSVVGLLFCFNGLHWQWYQIKIEAPVCRFFSNIVEKIYTKTGFRESK